MFKIYSGGGGIFRILPGSGPAMCIGVKLEVAKKPVHWPITTPITTLLAQNSCFHQPKHLLKHFYKTTTVKKRWQQTRTFKQFNVFVGDDFGVDINQSTGLLVSWIYMLWYICVCACVCECCPPPPFLFVSSFLPTPRFWTVWSGDFWSNDDDDDHDNNDNDKTTIKKNLTHETSESLYACG